MKQIGMALHEYHETYGYLPPAYVTDSSGRRLYGWRVLLLPFLDQQALYDQFRKDEAWDSPHNLPLLQKMPEVYRCPSHRYRRADSATDAHYSAVFGDGCAFEGADPIQFRDIRDRMDETLLVMEATQAGIPWTAPLDVNALEHPKLGDRTGFSSDHEGGLQALLGDGYVRFIGEALDPAIVRRLVLRDDGEAVGDF